MKKKEKMGYWTGKRWRRLYPCENKKCQHFSSTEGEYCCVWCGRYKERHLQKHTYDCENRLRKAEYVEGKKHKC